MDWFTEGLGDLWGGFTGGGGTGFWGGLGNLLGGSSSGNSMIDSLFGLGIGSLMQNQGWGDPKIPQVGYQGKIPEYAAVRQRVPMQPDANRRPGAGGQRYFSDMIFADAPERQPISIADAEAQTRQQAQGIAGLVPTYSAPTEKSTVTSNPASSVINTTPVDTNEPEENEDAIDTGGFIGGVMGNQGEYSGPKIDYGPEQAPERPVEFTRDPASEFGMNAGGMYLGGITDGMEDRIPGNVGTNDEVRLSDGEFVIPADVVSHLGNGNSNAGAAHLHDFMDSIRMERTGNSEQGRQINPNQFLQA